MHFLSSLDKIIDAFHWKFGRTYPKCLRAKFWYFVLVSLQLSLQLHSYEGLMVYQSYVHGVGISDACFVAYTCYMLGETCACTKIYM